MIARRYSSLLGVLLLLGVFLVLGSSGASGEPRRWDPFHGISVAFSHDLEIFVVRVAAVRSKSYFGFGEDVEKTWDFEVQHAVRVQAPPPKVIALNFGERWRNEVPERERLYLVGAWCWTRTGGPTKNCYAGHVVWMIPVDATTLMAEVSRLQGWYALIELKDKRERSVRLVDWLVKSCSDDVLGIEAARAIYLGKVTLAGVTNERRLSMSIAPTDKQCEAIIELLVTGRVSSNVAANLLALSLARRCSYEKRRSVEERLLKDPSIPYFSSILAGLAGEPIREYPSELILPVR